ncbi:MAG: hypothetical protein AAB890_02175 [Patescibacteria group bacterium]
MPKDRKNGEFFAVAGELGPNCGITSIILFLSACPVKKKKITITEIPYGPNIPEEIRRGWIGAIVDGARGPLTTSTRSVVNESSSDTVFTKGYAIDTSVALKSLKRVNIKSWKWFSNEKLPKYLFFNETCCRVTN